MAYLTSIPQHENHGRFAQNCPAWAKKGRCFADFAMDPKVTSAGHGRSDLKPSETGNGASPIKNEGGSRIYTETHHAWHRNPLPNQEIPSRRPFFVTSDWGISNSSKYNQHQYVEWMYIYSIYIYMEYGIWMNMIYGFHFGIYWNMLDEYDTCWMFFNSLKHKNV